MLATGGKVGIVIGGPDDHSGLGHPKVLGIKPEIKPFLKIPVDLRRYWPSPGDPYRVIGIILSCRLLIQDRRNPSQKVKGRCLVLSYLIPESRCTEPLSDGILASYHHRFQTGKILGVHMEQRQGAINDIEWIAKFYLHLGGIVRIIHQLIKRDGLKC